MATMQNAVSNRDPRSRINQTSPSFVVVVLTLGLLGISHATTMAMGGFFEAKSLIWRAGPLKPT